MRIKKIICSLSTTGILALVAPASAVTITGTNGLNSLGHFSAELTYSAISVEKAMLTVDLSNLSGTAPGGKITAFALNNPKEKISSASLDIFTSPTFKTLLGLGSVSTSPFGFFDLGVTTQGNFNGGGNPNKGIAVGETERFTFGLSGTGLNTLTANDFIHTLSTGGSKSSFFLVRFRGFDGEGSDKVPGDVVPNPEPGTMLLLGTGLVGLGAYYRRKKS